MSGMSSCKAGCLMSRGSHRSSEEHERSELHVNSLQWEVHTRLRSHSSLECLCLLKEKSPNERNNPATTSLTKYLPVVSSPVTSLAVLSSRATASCLRLLASSLLMLSCAFGPPVAIPWRALAPVLHALTLPSFRWPSHHPPSSRICAHSRCSHRLLHFLCQRSTNFSVNSQLLSMLGLVGRGSRLHLLGSAVVVGKQPWAAYARTRGCVHENMVAPY